MKARGKVWGSFFRAGFCLLFGVALSSCAHPRMNMQPSAVPEREVDKSTALSTRIEPEARPLFNQAEQLFKERKYDEAIEVYKVVRTKFPSGRAAGLSSYRIATALYYRGDYPAAGREFESYLAKHPQSELTFDATYNLAAAHYQMGNYERAYQVLSRLKLSDIQAQGPRRAEVVFQLTGQAAGALNHHVAAVVAYSYQMQLPLPEKNRDEIQADIAYHLEKIKNPADLERIHSEISDPITQSKVKARLAQLRVPAPARGEATVIASAAPLSSKTVEPLGDETGDEVSFASRSAERQSVGVVLPLSGRSAPYGKKALDGILLAANLFRPSGSGGPDIKLHIVDSASSPVMAVQAVDRLVNEHKVIGIIGPLHGKEASQVAARCQRLGIANLSLSTKEGISERGSYLFQNALTPSVQIENLVQYAVRNRQFKRFAILAPDDGFGKDMTRQFWEAAERFGAVVVGYEAYPPLETDFQAYVRSLVLLDNPTRFRRLEMTRLTEFAQQVKAKTGREPKLQLPPVIDFDALFIPDVPSKVAQIAASLSFFEVNGVALLGTTDWNSEQLYKRAGKLVEGAIFPGGISLATRNPKQQQFIREYAEAYGMAPDLLAAQAYEAMQLLMTAFSRGGAADRDALTMTLASLKDWESPLGLTSFDEKRLARRRLPIYFVGAGGEILEN